MFDLYGAIDICTGMDIMGMIVITGIAASVIREKNVKGEKLNYMFLLLVGCFFMLGADIAQGLVLTGKLPMSWYMFSEGLLYVSMMASAIFLSFYMLHELRKSSFISGDVDYALIFVFLVAVIVWIIGAVQDPNWFFDLDADMPVSKAGNTAIQVVPALMLLFDLCLAASFSGEVRARSLRAWIVVCALPIFAVFVGIFIIHFPSYAIGSMSCFVLYIIIHNDAVKQQLINEKELVASKSQLMVSQIQPHFIYNSLNTIYYLIDMDQEQARDAVSTFSDYLRQNINALKDDKPVHFREELEHIRAYVSLEMLRFGERLNVVYEIEAEDFFVPPLTIQPLVENAIKHGVSVKEEGGTVKITTRSTREGVILSVEDDGVGFDTTRFSDDKKSTHVGLYNVRSRLMTMCDAELTVTSRPGEGTVCSIAFKKMS